MLPLLPLLPQILCAGTAQKDAVAQRTQEARRERYRAVRTQERTSSRLRHQIQAGKRALERMRRSLRWHPVFPFRWILRKRNRPTHMQRSLHPSDVPTFPPPSDMVVQTAPTPGDVQEQIPCVTVIIPVFRNITATVECLESCKAHIDPRHTILVINDASPEPGMAEAMCRVIQDMPNARYTENPRNLGFVETCNRAVCALDTSENDILLLNADTVVTEGCLEELQACLQLSDRHAVACPRSNHATICTIPVKYQGPRTGFAERSFRCWKRLQGVLRRCTPIPTAVGFCMLIRRSVIRNFGLFDPIYSPGYNEENDFCRRINRYGYSVVLCNRAYVFHRGETSFGRKRQRHLEEAHARILRKRYPEYPRAVRDYRTWDMDAVEHFADVLGGCHDRPRLCIDCSALHLHRDGTTEYAMEITRRLIPLLRPKCDVLITAPRATQEYFCMREMGMVAEPQALQDWHADLVFTPHQIFHPRQLFWMNTHGVRLAFTLQDMICMRCHALQNPALILGWHTAVRECDGIIYISETARRDAEAYYGPARTGGHQRSAVIHHGIQDPPASVPPSADAPILLIGNAFEHKALHKALEYLPSDLPLTVLGLTPQAAPTRSNAQFLRSGQLSTVEIQRLYAGARALVFPSQYEGFGLPLLHAAAAGLPILAADTEINREVRRVMGLERHMHLFRRFDDIPQLLERILLQPRPGPARLRSWDTCAGETADFLWRLMETPVDVDALERRFRVILNMERACTEYAAHAPEADVQRSARDLARSLIIRAGLGPAARRLQAALRARN